MAQIIVHRLAVMPAGSGRSLLRFWISCGQPNKKTANRTKPVSAVAPYVAALAEPIVWNFSHPSCLVAWCFAGAYLRQYKVAVMIAG